MKKLSIIILYIISAPCLYAGKINSFEIGYETLKGYTEGYPHYKLIGGCSWIKKRSFPRPSSYQPSLEIEYFYPDLVVSVFNKNGDNPWTEADLLLDKPSSWSINEALKSQLGIELGGTDITDSFYRNSSTGIRRKVVDIVGHPNTLIKPPLPAVLSSDTYPLVPYYQSQLDVLNTIGAAETINRPFETWNILGGFIGSRASHWSYMFPREMSAIINNDYKAALVFAARAAHVVTNNNGGHVVNSTNNSCGVNCRVATVQYEEKEKFIKWQQVYPKNEHIKLGQNDSSLSSMGSEYANKGDGNYVFVIWRRYQGCVQPIGSGYKLYKPGTTKIFKPTVRA